MFSEYPPQIHCQPTPDDPPAAKTRNYTFTNRGEVYTWIEHRKDVDVLEGYLIAGDFYTHVTVVMPPESNPERHNVQQHLYEWMSMIRAH